MQKGKPAPSTGPDQSGSVDASPHTPMNRTSARISTTPVASSASVDLHQSSPKDPTQVFVQFIPELEQSSSDKLKRPSQNVHVKPIRQRLTVAKIQGNKSVVRNASALPSVHMTPAETVDLDISPYVSPTKPPEKCRHLASPPTTSTRINSENQPHQTHNPTFSGSSTNLPRISPSPFSHNTIDLPVTSFLQPSTSTRRPHDMTATIPPPHIPGAMVTKAGKHCSTGMQPTNSPSHYQQLPPFPQVSYQVITPLHSPPYSDVSCGVQAGTGPYSHNTVASPQIPLTNKSVALMSLQAPFT